MNLVSPQHPTYGPRIKKPILYTASLITRKIKRTVSPSDYKICSNSKI